MSPGTLVRPIRPWSVGLWDSPTLDCLKCGVLEDSEYATMITSAHLRLSQLVHERHWVYVVATDVWWCLADLLEVV